MAFTTEEKERIRYHTGYLEVSPAPSITFGIPALIQTNFLVERAMDLVLPAAEGRVRKILCVLEGIECKMIEWQDYLIASQLDSLTIRADNIDKLEDEYSRWASRLADILGCPLYPGSSKFRRLFRSIGGGNIPVRNA